MSILWQEFYGACAQRDITRIKLLGSPSTFAVSQDMLRRTPLHYACIWSFTELAVYMLRHGAFTLVTDRDGNTPFHFAVVTGNATILSLLLSHTPETLSIGILVVLACKANQPTVLPILFEYAQQEPRKFVDSKGRTLLHIAAACGSADIIEYALAWGVSPNALNAFGGTALHEAFTCTEGGLEDTILLLLNAGINVNITDQKGCVAWHSRRITADMKALLESISKETCVVFENCPCQKQNMAEIVPESGNLLALERLRIE